MITLLKFTFVFGFKKIQKKSSIKGLSLVIPIFVYLGEKIKI